VGQNTPSFTRVSMMSLIQKPITIPPDITLRKAADVVRAAAEDLALERCSATGLLELAHHRVARALDLLSGECLSTSQLPTSEEARALWSRGELPRVEISKVGCMVVPALPRS